MAKFPKLFRIMALCPSSKKREDLCCLPSQEDCSYTVMEYANAGTLADYLPKRARRSDSELARMLQH